MANRNVLHIKHLAKFRAWLEKEGFTALPLSEHGFEVLKMKKDRRTIIIYRKMRTSEHLSVMDKDMGLVWAFLRSVKGEG